MRRRVFLQRLGLGTTGLMATSNLVSADPLKFKNNFEVRTFSDLYNQEGQVMLRFNYFSDHLKHQVTHEGRFRVKKGKIARIRAYFFQPGFDDMDPKGPAMDILSSATNEDVVVMWIEEASPETTVTFPAGSGKASVTLGTILEKEDIVIQDDEAKVTVSYLLDREIGEIDPSRFGITDPGNNFTFTAMADPQGGDPYAHDSVPTRMRIHNAFIDESVNLVNSLDPKPAFNIVIGDIVDGQGHHADFRAMNDRLSKADVPTLYEIGNHETRYRLDFSPGYNMSGFNNYFAAQKEFNGMDKMLYSYNLGEWHFIVWPDPLRKRFWQTHPHYFDWLERDLEKNSDRPTMFFQHVPMHPIGILPLINYAESVEVKRTLLEMLSRHGNVRYILSGHVHIPMKASVKTSSEYRGIKMINLPAAGYRPRAFGEEEYNGGPTQGIAIVRITGKEAEIDYRTVTHEQFTYPDPAPFDEEKYPLWLKHKWELAIDPPLRNGDFNEGLKHWHRRYVYTEDVHPSNLCETRKHENGFSFLYLFNRSRGYSTPGQDRLPQSINRICQVVRQPRGMFPLIRLGFLIDPDHHIPGNKAGSLIWLEGFENGLKRLNVVYSVNYVHWHLGGDQSQLRTTLPVHLDISGSPGAWHDLFLNPAGDFLRFTEDEEVQLDRIDTFAINFGVWTINEGHKNAAAAGFREVDLNFVNMPDPASAISTMNESPIPRKEQKYLWWHGVKHYAGEHKSYIEDLNKYLK